MLRRFLARLFPRAARLGVAAACVAGLAFAAAAPGAIRLTGSDTMLILNQELSQRYVDAHPGAEIAVVGGGSERGIRALMAGEVDIAAASRAMREAELAAFEERTGRRPIEYVVALDGIAFYVHTSNPVLHVTMDELAGILTGDIRNWSEVSDMNRQRIHIYSRDRFSGTKTFVDEHVLRGREFADYTVYVSSTSLVTACVQRNPRAIGYGGVAHAENTRILRIADAPDDFGYWPSKENVSSGKYPVSRPLHFYVNPASVTPELEAFIDWVLGPEGQKVVEFVGYYPVSMPGEEPPTLAAAEGTPVPADSAETAPRPEPALPTTGVVALNPDNAGAFGFDVTVEIAPAGEGQPRPVAVYFGPEDEALEAVETIELQLGEDAVVPLLRGTGGALRFSLRAAALNAATVRLIEPGAPDGGRVFLLPVRAFAGAAVE